MPPTILQLKVTLRPVRPPIWRRLEIPTSTTLLEFHHILQGAMGWTDSHLHQFVQNGVFYGAPDREFGMPMVSERQTRVGDLLNAGTYRPVCSAALIRQALTELSGHCARSEVPRAKRALLATGDAWRSSGCARGLQDFIYGRTLAEVHESPYASNVVVVHNDAPLRSQRRKSASQAAYVQQRLAAEFDKRGPSVRKGRSKRWWQFWMRGLTRAGTGTSGGALG